ncbi:hypothetical protein HMPREF0043_02084 [Actinobaculum sp. oral taxon 183 str. F0552]|nr:hypothetical protein HMPREF0043_02084 [Actinobaculum sp. oral taxon 183 str. F0552]
MCYSNISITFWLKATQSIFRKEVNIAWVTFLIFRRRRRRLLMCVAGVPALSGRVTVRQAGRAAK